MYIGGKHILKLQSHLHEGPTLYNMGILQKIVPMWILDMGARARHEQELFVVVSVNLCVHLPRGASEVLWGYVGQHHSNSLFAPHGQNRNPSYSLLLAR